MNRKERKSKTRERILDSALTLFCQKGFLAATIDDITRHAGLSHGSFFVHFPKKEDLITELIDQVGREIYRMFTSVGEKNLEDLLRTHLAALKDYESFYRHLVIDSPSLPAQVRGSLFLLNNGIAHRLQLELEKGIAGKNYKALSQQLFFNTWLGLIHHYLINRDLFAPGQSVLEAKAEELIRHFLALIIR